MANCTDANLYITRKEIISLTGASKSQVYKVTADRSIFPEPAGFVGFRKKVVWYRLEVLEFLKHHEWKTPLDRNITQKRVYGKPRGRYEHSAEYLRSHYNAS
jgi:predicted DNA-binding transcriptional regulator AlpA